MVLRESELQDLETLNFYVKFDRLSDGVRGWLFDWLRENDIEPEHVLRVYWGKVVMIDYIDRKQRFGEHMIFTADNPLV